MSIPEINGVTQAPSRPVVPDRVAAPSPFSQNSLSSAAPSRGCLEIYGDFFQAIITFIKEKICCCFFSSPEQMAAVAERNSSTPPPASENSNSLLPEQSPATETVEAPRMISQETLRRVEELRARIAEFQNFVPQFPEDQDPDAIRNDHDPELPHFNRTNRQAFDDMQDAYLHIIALMRPILVVFLEVQRDSQFRLSFRQLAQIFQPNDIQIGSFHEERRYAGDFQFDTVFGGFRSIHQAIADLQFE